VKMEKVLEGRPPAAAGGEKKRRSIKLLSSSRFLRYSLQWKKTSFCRGPISCKGRSKRTTIIQELKEKDMSFPGANLSGEKNLLGFRLWGEKNRLRGGFNLVE